MTWLRRLADWLYQRPYFLLSIAYLTWAYNIVLGRFVAGHVPPVALTYLRWGLAFLILLVFTWPHLKRDWPAIRKNLPLLTVLSIVGVPVFNVLSYWGLQYTQALNGLLIQSISPLAIALWAMLLFRDRLTLMQTIGITTSFVGVLIILCRGDFVVLRSIDFNIGDIACVAGMMAFTFYSALVKKRPAIHPLSFATFTMGWGTFLLTPLYIGEIASGYTVPLDVTTIVVVVTTAVFSSVIAMICYNRGIELVGPNRAATHYPLIVVYGAVLAILFLGERPQPFHAIGFMAVFAGVIVATRERR